MAARRIRSIFSCSTGRFSYFLILVRVKISFILFIPPNLQFDFFHYIHNFIRSILTKIRSILLPLHIFHIGITGSFTQLLCHTLFHSNDGLLYENNTNLSPSYPYIVLLAYWSYIHSIIMPSCARINQNMRISLNQNSDAGFTLVAKTKSYHHRICDAIAGINIP